MPTKSDVAAPGARAVARHVRISATKARRMVNLVRGMPAQDALTVLKFAPQAADAEVEVDETTTEAAQAPAKKATARKAPAKEAAAAEEPEASAPAKKAAKKAATKAEEETE